MVDQRTGLPRRLSSTGALNTAMCCFFLVPQRVLVAQIILLVVLEFAPKRQRSTKTPRIFLVAATSVVFLGVGFLCRQLGVKKKGCDTTSAFQMHSVQTAVLVCDHCA